MENGKKSKPNLKENTIYRVNTPNSKGIIGRAITTRKLLLNRLTHQLRNGVVAFWYLDKDGNIRPALGTLNPKCIPVLSEEHSKALLTALAKWAMALQGMNHKKPEEVLQGKTAVGVDLQNYLQVMLAQNKKIEAAATKDQSIADTYNYFDLERQAPRTFKVDRLLAVLS